MIEKLLIALAPVAATLFLAELLWRSGRIAGERGRKLIHILAGSWVAFWPYFLPFDGIFVLASMMLVLLIYSRITNLFKAIYDVKRKTYGDILYAIGLLVCAYLGKADWVFCVSVLFLALADGGAAVAGRFWGVKNAYNVFGSKHLRKSVTGTVVFVLAGILSMAVGWWGGGEAVISNYIVLCFLILPFAAAAIENLLPFGLDNVATPLLVTIVLNSLL